MEIIFQALPSSQPSFADVPDDTPHTVIKASFCDGKNDGCKSVIENVIEFFLK